MQGGCSLVHFQPDLLPDEPASDHYLAIDGQQGSAIQPSVWPVLLALSPYPDVSEGTSLQGTGLLDCWPKRLDLTNWMNEQELPILQGVRDHLIVDEASHVANATFYLVVPTNGANCGISDS